MATFRDHMLWKTAKRLAIDPARRVAFNLTSRGVPLSWCVGSNWGDALSPILVSLLSGKPVVHVDGLHHDRYLSIGSILGSANERAEVWGSGFIRENEPLIGRPRTVHAVRGPLTRDGLLKHGVECPEVYGDPALLLPRFFNPQIDQRYSVGIIPHYIEKGHPWIERHRSDPNVRVIDIENGIGDFVREVKSCGIILSSSLHGLICSDAYGVPSAWINLSDRVIGSGFKFRDYRMSIGDDCEDPVNVDEQTSLARVTSKAIQQPVEINLRKLLLACPFLSNKLRREVEDMKPGSCGLPEHLASWKLRGNEFEPQIE